MPVFFAVIFHSILFLLAAGVIVWHARRIAEVHEKYPTEQPVPDTLARKYGCCNVTSLVTHVVMTLFLLTATTRLLHAVSATTHSLSSIKCVIIAELEFELYVTFKSFMYVVLGLRAAVNREKIGKCKWNASVFIIICIQISIFVLALVHARDIEYVDSSCLWGSTHRHSLQFLFIFFLVSSITICGWWMYLLIHPLRQEIEYERSTVIFVAYTIEDILKNIRFWTIVAIIGTTVTFLLALFVPASRDYMFGLDQLISCVCIIHQFGRPTYPRCGKETERRLDMSIRDHSLSPPSRSTTKSPIRRTKSTPIATLSPVPDINVSSSPAPPIPQPRISQIAATPGTPVDTPSLDEMARASSSGTLDIDVFGLQVLAQQRKEEREGKQEMKIDESIKEEGVVPRRRHSLPIEGEVRIMSHEDELALIRQNIFGRELDGWITPKSPASPSQSAGALMTEKEKAKFSSMKLYRTPSV